MYIGIGYANHDYGSIFNLKIDNNKILLGLNKTNTWLFNLNLITKIDYKKEVVSFLTRINTFNHSLISENPDNIIELDYSLDNLEFLLFIITEIEDFDSSQYVKQVIKKDKEEQSYLNFLDYIKTNSIKLTNKTKNQVKKEILITEIPKQETITQLSSLIKDKIKNLKETNVIVKTLPKDIILSPKEELLADYNKLTSNPFWMEVDTDEILGILTHSKLLSKTHILEFSKLIKEFEEDENYKKWSGNNQIFLDIKHIIETEYF